ncbi:MAG: PEGA domain-containing protein [Myxococcota bacterium]|nr:PEGA domain-containing protein [Myxococcota bacterium]
MGDAGVALAEEDASGEKEKILGLKIEGLDLDDKDKADLFKVLQKRLLSYPYVHLVQPPEGELTDQMIELECVDVDMDCLARVGAAEGATKVFYAQVDVVKGKYEMWVQLVAVGSAKSLFQERRKVSKRTKLAPTLQKLIGEAFGAPPKPKAKKGKLVIEVAPRGAKIYINGDYAGVTRVTRKKIAPGTYNVRVTRPSDPEELLVGAGGAGATAHRKVNLQVIPGPPVRVEATAAAEVTEPAPFYKKWWFWTSVGAATVVTTVLAVLASGEEELPTGGVVLSVDGVDAWQDSAIPGAARAGASGEGP